MEVFKDVLSEAAFSAQKLKKVNLFDTARMFCDVYGLEPGQEQAGHAHAGSDKVYFVIDGHGVFAVGNQEHTASAGYAVLAPAGTSHGVRNAGPGRLTLLVFMAPKP
jgi:mannose-6-phosphate isomerase-like protein (cupin superfamily)